MRQSWLEIIRTQLREVEGAAGTFRNHDAREEHPFRIEYSLRVVLGAGELSPYSSAPHEHLHIYKGAPGGDDVLLDTTREAFLVVRSQSTEALGEPPAQRLQVRMHTHFIPWDKIVDLEIIETRHSLV